MYKLRKQFKLDAKDSINKNKGSQQTLPLEVLKVKLTNQSGGEDRSKCVVERLFREDSILHAL